MLLATRSFLSAFSFSFKISILVSALEPAAGCAMAETAQSISPVKNNDTTFIMMCVLSVEGTPGYFFFVNAEMALRN
jgi:hypothetical protein